VEQYDGVKVRRVQVSCKLHQIQGKVILTYKSFRTLKHPLGNTWQATPATGMTPAFDDVCEKL